jgi:hypothetical protein
LITPVAGTGLIDAMLGGRNVRRGIAADAS